MLLWEDPFDQDDWDAYKMFMTEVGKEPQAQSPRAAVHDRSVCFSQDTQIVGDDLQRALAFIMHPKTKDAASNS